VGHLRENGYDIQTNEISDLQLIAIKDKYGVPQTLRTCHTAIVDGYVIEGHVPAELIQHLLKEKPALAGLGVPGMPIGSPGMYGPKPQPYDVFSFDRKGQVKLYKHMPPFKQ
jgi:hypothetical protein